MIIELNMIQNFAPSCLNRDDTNTPKDCVFGGVRRARISSQCIKRAIRTQSMKHMLAEDDMAVRTKRLQKVLTDRFVEQGKPVDDANEVASKAIGAAIKAVDKNMKTPYLLYLGVREIEDVVGKIIENWDAPYGKKTVAKDVANSLKAIFNGGKAADLALFGRMVADLAQINIDAACQVAHAISTHKVDMDMDYYVAVDDLQPEDTSGADMIGTVEFNSACFYRYAVIHWEKLVENLAGDKDLAKRTVEAFLRGSMEAIPTGKQNSFAAHNPPSFIHAMVREKGIPWSLANAFESPVRSNGNGLSNDSVRKMNDYLGKLLSVYGNGDIAKLSAWTAIDDSNEIKCMGEQKATAKDLIVSVLEALS